MSQTAQERPKRARQLIEEAQAARVQAHVRIMLSRLSSGAHRLILGPFSRSQDDASERACCRPD